MKKPFGLALLMIGVALAGCLGGDDSGDGGDGSPPVGDPCVADPIGWTPDGVAEHDHKDRSHHAAPCNLTRVWHSSMTEQFGQFAGAHAMDLHEESNLLVVSVEWGDQGRGFDLYDVTDPESLAKVGEYRNEQASGGDRNVAFSEDGQYVFMANEAGGQAAATSAGVRVVDVSDPANPEDALFYNIAPSGVHTVTAFTVDGVQYVAALNFGVHILRVTEDPLGDLRMVTVGRFATATPQQIAAHPEPGPTPFQRDIYGHDTWVTEDPITGQTLLYFAYSYEGVRVLDVSTPSAPTIVASWVPQDEYAPHYIHDVRAFVNADDRRIMVVEAETFEDRHIDVASPLWIVDVTDFDNPVELFRWTNPGGHGSDNLGLSTHFFRFLGEHLVLSHYHGGVWILDLADPENVTVDAYYMPVAETGYDAAVSPLQWNLDMIPMTFDVEVDARGYVYAADLSTGLYSLRWDEAPA